MFVRWSLHLNETSNLYYIGLGNLNDGKLGLAGHPSDIE